MTVRNQDYHVVAIGTLGAGVPKVITLPRPRTLPAMSDNWDHVTDPTQRRDFEAGKCIVSLDLVLLADLMLTKVEILRDADSPFRVGPPPAGSAAEPLFPNGAPSTTARESMSWSAGVDIGTTPAASIVEYLANLWIGANEYIQMTVVSAAGGAAGSLNVAYDLGRNSTSIGLREQS